MFQNFLLQVTMTKKNISVVSTYLASFAPNPPTQKEVKAAPIGFQDLFVFLTIPKILSCDDIAVARPLWSPSTRAFGWIVLTRRTKQRKRRERPTRGYCHISQAKGYTQRIWNGGSNSWEIYFLSLCLTRRGQTMKPPCFGRMLAMFSSDSDATHQPGPHAWTFLLITTLVGN